MKIRYLLIFIIPLVITIVSCSKKEDPAPVPAGNELTFSSLTATDTVMAVNGFTTITASATGEGLSYTWTSEYGTFIGSGNTVQWTVCHADKFRITCEVKDGSNNKISKDIYIRTYEQTK